MSTYDNTDRTAYITLGVIFGTVIGVAAGMLMAPRSGEETRGQLRQRAHDAKGKAQDQLHGTRDAAMDKLSKTLDKSQDVANKAADKTKAVADKTSERAKSAADDARKEVETNRAANDESDTTTRSRHTPTNNR